MTRLVESLLTVLFEGRQALPRTASATVTATSALGRYALRRLDGSAGIGGGSATDRTNRHLIELIRNRDFDGLVEAMETSPVDVNLVDDVGQSLLNCKLSSHKDRENSIKNMSKREIIGGFGSFRKVFFENGTIRL